MEKGLKILILEDRASDAKLVKLELRKINREFESRVVQDEKNFLKELAAFKPDIILSDYSMPQFTGLDALEIAKKKCPEIPFIIVTGSINEEIAVECMRQGAWDYVIKDKLSRLGPVIKRALKEAEEHKARKKTEEINLRLAEIIRNAGDGIILTNPEGKTYYVNPSFEKMSGYTLSELLNTDPANQIVSEDTTAIAKEIRSEVKTKGEWKGELVCRRKNGEIYPIDTRVFAIKSSKGELVEIAAIQQDISERKQAENVLADSELQFHCLSDASMEGIGIIQDGKVVVTNKKACELFDYDQNEIIGKPLLELVALESRELALKNFRDRYKEPFEIVAFRKNDSKFLAEVCGKSIEFKGHPGRVIAIRDITERKQAEKDLENLYKKSEKSRTSLFNILEDVTEKEAALRESQERFQDIVTNSGDWIWETDREGRYTYCSPVVKQVLGYEPDAVLGKHFYDFFHPDERDDMKKAAFNLFQKKEKFKDLINRNVHKDGSVIFLETNCVPLLDDKGNISGYRGIDRDITERIQAEKIQRALYDISNALNTVDNLHELFLKIREFLGNVIDTTNFYVALYDKKTDMLSLPFDVDEKDDFEIFPAGKTLTAYVIKTGKPLLVDDKLLDRLIKEGHVESIGAPSEIWLGVPLKVESEIIGVIAVQSYDDPNLYTEKDIDILTFISEEIALAIKHKQADESLRIAHEELKGMHKNLEKKVKKAVKEVEEKNLVIVKQTRQVAMAEMISTIAHHWRQPLNSIGVIIQNIEDAYEYDELTAEYLRDKVKTTMELSKSMSRTIDSFSYFFRTAAEKEEFIINEIIKELVNLSISSFRDSNINLIFEFKETCLITGYPNEFSQALLGIINNAREILIEREIKNPWTKIFLSKENNKSVITINDNAGGIQDDIIEKIFDPYFSTKQELTGTGIGLYMAKMVIERNMSGKLTVRNTDVGTEFRIEV